MKIKFLSFLLSALLLMSSISLAQNNIIVFQSDFGLKDGAVAAMKGVALGVSANLKLYDLTHEIPAYNIWEASYRLLQTVPYYPSGTVFVSVVDPGVGTDRKSVVLKTSGGQYIVSPDNGTLALLADEAGIAELREIDETVNRRQGSQQSYTFHGRDVYAYTAARLASGKISFSGVGKLLAPEVVHIPYQKAVMEGTTLKGNITVLDIQYGNIWTNIGDDLLKKLGIGIGDKLHVTITHQGKTKYEGNIPYHETFAGVPKASPLIYLNSLMQVSLALNQGSFSAVHRIQSGNDWSIELKRFQKK
ncbi:SAM hydrolase/SAM-dependent halogenase family protein [Pedobacter sp. AW31-3R]|uniref:SAM hydrolase/SAM-dependent halogenase family protein n=1 Tax=Pedobacter sp. AW31-3R TaxID=3445781 RepID=UPI003F9F0093